MLTYTDLCYYQNTLWNRHYQLLFTDRKAKFQKSKFGPQKENKIPWDMITCYIWLFRGNASSLCSSSSSLPPPTLTVLHNQKRGVTRSQLPNPQTQASWAKISVLYRILRGLWLVTVLVGVQQETMFTPDGSNGETLIEGLLTKCGQGTENKHGGGCFCLLQ